MSGVIAGAAIGYGVGGTAIAAGVGGMLGGSVIGSINAGKQADRAYASADTSARLQFDISQQQIDMAKEQWASYKENILPLEMEAQRLGLDRTKIDSDIYKKYYAPISEKFATDAMDGVEAQPERVARDARLQVDQAFDTEEGMMQRNLERRGVKPGSGNYASGVADTSLARAAAKGFTVNRAVEGERDRVEDVNFNRQAVALGRQPLASGTGSPGVTPSTSAYNMAAGGNTAQGAGSQYASIGNAYGNAAGGIMSGGIQLGMQAYDLYNKYATPSMSSGYNMAQAQTGTSAAPGSAAEFAAFAEGGQVNAPELGRAPTGDGGMVNGPPGRDMVPAYIEGSDGQTQPARLTNEEYVIPADVVKRIGTNALDDIIELARNNKEKSKSSPNALTRRLN